MILNVSVNQEKRSETQSDRYHFEEYRGKYYTNETKHNKKHFQR